jgi:HD-GYP domain-containing protein (c-di-GMP phosphodiesterase class II)
MATATKTIELAEDDAMDIYLLLVETNDDILGKMLSTKDRAMKMEYIKHSLKVHEKIELIARKLGLDE